MRSFSPLIALTIMLFLSSSLLACEDTSSESSSESSLEETIRGLIEEYAGASVAVVVRDAQTSTEIAVNPNRSFHAASTMKIPVMIEVFRQAEQGRFSLDDSLEVKNEFRSIVDGSVFSIEDDSDDAIYERLGGYMRIRELVHNMITVSSNLATNLLIDFVMADSVQTTIKKLGTQTMSVLRGVEDLMAYRQGLNNTATAGDLALLLDLLARSTVVSEEADLEMIEILLGQQHNEMIPAGLPPDTRVAHKTGWITGIHHDAAIVIQDYGDPYILVILTEGLESFDVSAALGAKIAGAVHRTIRPAS